MIATPPKEKTLVVVMYHYVRDLARSQFPRIRGMHSEDFRRQVAELGTRYEWATLESARAFLEGCYSPDRDLCLLTFDDGLKDHYSNVFPVLAEKSIQGLFFLPTCCIEQREVIDVHKNHFLMAALSFAEYSNALLSRLEEITQGALPEIDKSVARRTYRWDTDEVAHIKYRLNFSTPFQLRKQVLDELFQQFLGNQHAFADELYMNWDEARQLQDGGMLLGGHSHRHAPLASLDEASQQLDLDTCTRILRIRANEQPWWPFSYPYGKCDIAFSSFTEQLVEQLGYSCAFSTEVGANRVGQSQTRICRMDPKDV